MKKQLGPGTRPGRSGAVGSKRIDYFVEFLVMVDLIHDLYFSIYREILKKRVKYWKLYAKSYTIKRKCFVGKRQDIKWEKRLQDYSMLYDR